MSDCQHDDRFAGVFDLPKECGGCLACWAEQQASQLVHARGVINELADRLALTNGTTVPHEIHDAECSMELAALNESEAGE